MKDHGSHEMGRLAYALTDKRDRNEHRAFRKRLMKLEEILACVSDHGFL